MVTFRRLAKDSSGACQNAVIAMEKWDNTIKELRLAIFEKQQVPPPAPAVPVPEPELPLSALVLHSHNYYLVSALIPSLQHPFWGSVLSCEACLRRFYKCLTSSASGSVDWTLLRSQPGMQYLTLLLSKFEYNQGQLSAITSPQSAVDMNSYFAAAVAVSSLPHSKHWEFSNRPRVSASSSMPTNPPATLTST